MIKIEHNIKRDGCTLSGQILDCQFSGDDSRGAIKTIRSEDKTKLILSTSSPALSDNTIWIYGRDEKYDFVFISHTYPTNKAAQDMLDFINTFTEEPVKEIEKSKYTFLEVGGEECKFRSRNVLIQSVKYFCRIDYEDCDIEHCKNCPHGKTPAEIAEEVKKLQGAQND